MGIGDEIMISGEVRKLVRVHGDTLRVAILDARIGRPEHRWEDIWAGNPNIARPGEPFDMWFKGYPGFRPYIAKKSPAKWTWREYTPEPGAIYLTPSELAFAKETEGRVVINPTIKPGASPNKSWGFDKWQDLIDSARHLPWAQVGTAGSRVLRGVRFVQTNTFREASGALTGASMCVLHEGGLHHAAAALDVPAVVIFGGFISPKVTGYAQQTSLFFETPEHPLGCGHRQQCTHCLLAMQGIQPKHVLQYIEKRLK